MARARALQGDGLDLALDLQGDLRASLLLWATGASRRVGYANTGGDYLLTDVVPLDETVSWVEQNRAAVAVALAGTPGEAASHEPLRDVPRVDPLTAADRAFAESFLQEAGLLGRGPLVGLHPSGGRPIKAWPIDRWREVAARLQEDHGATVLVTGSAADRDLARRLADGLPRPPLDLTGRLDVRQSLAVIARLRLFLSSDTGPMHLACAVGTPSVSVFGPSDSVRYFTGGAFDGRPERHLVVRHELWCAPCNLIRRPPAECETGEAPECLRLVTVDAVHAAAVSLLGERR
jgi:ADP-heptose:LPS heptosyltransferase